MKELAQEKKIYVTKNPIGRRSKIKYLWDEKNEHCIGTTTIHYDAFQHGARTPDMPENQMYKISKKVYTELLKILAG